MLCLFRAMGYAISDYLCQIEPSDILRFNFTEYVVGREVDSGDALNPIEAAPL